MSWAYIGLGANLGDPSSQIRAALAALANITATRLADRSSFYRSAPIGNIEQPDYINAVARIQTELPPRALLDALLAIESRLGRTRSHANAPRTLDLDLLLYDQTVIGEPGLSVPHPRMHSRAFVLAPLAEIAPEIEIPGKGPIMPLLAACAGQPIQRLAE